MYVVVTVGLATGLLIVVLLKSFVGVQLYVYGVVPPVALAAKVVELCAHIVTSAPALGTGLGFTVIVIVAVFKHPFASVAVTV